MTMNSTALPMPSQAELEGKGTYAYAIDHFNGWCIENDHQPFAALYNSIAQWLSDNSASWGWNTQYNYSAAIIYAHKCAGSMPRGDRGILKQLLWSTRPSPNEIRKAPPLLPIDIDGVLSMLRTEIPVDARDGALFAIGWGASISRKNLIGLDWHEIGDGSGCARVAEHGVLITLRRRLGAKTSEIRISDNMCPPARKWLEAWVAHLGLLPGQHIFRPVGQGQIIGLTRLTDHSVNTIIKSRISELVQTLGFDKEDADAFASPYTSHSLRNPMARVDAQSIEEQLEGKRKLTKGSVA